MGVSFKNYETGKIHIFVSERNTKNQELHAALNKIEALHEESNKILDSIGFGLRLDYFEIKRSIQAYIGTHSTEIMDAQKELDTRDAKERRI